MKQKCLIRKSVAQVGLKIMFYFESKIKTNYCETKTAIKKWSRDSIPNF